MQVEMLREQIQRLHDKGLIDFEIAERLGVSRSLVSDHCQYLGLRSNRKSHSHQEYKELYDQGLGDNQISEALGVAISTVRSWRSSFSYPPNQALREGNAIREMLKEPDEVFEK